MALIRIAESLHCHIPSVQKSARRWLSGDALDREAGERHLRSIVLQQARVKADYMDVNVDNFLTEASIGREGATEVMGHILDLIVKYGNGIPPCIDSSDPEILEWGLRRYCEELRGARHPLANSVTITRLDPLRMRAHFRFSIVGMLLEHAGEATGFTDIAGPEVYHETAREVFHKARAAGFAADEVYFDPTVGPLGADMVGYTRRTFDGVRMIREDAEMGGVHICLGLSNCSDGLPRRAAVNRAYLRVAMEYGVDAAICDATQISGDDLVDGRILKLIRQIAGGESMDTLTLLVDFTQAYPRSSAPARRQPVPDAFGEALARGDKAVYVLEVAPMEESLDQAVALAEAARDTAFHLAIADSPGSEVLPGPDALAVEVARIMGRQPVVTLSCKSADRSGLTQRLLSLYHLGVRNCLAVTGNQPVGGRPSFDLDSVSLLTCADALRRGLDFPSLMPRPAGALEGLRLGAAVSPFKYLEADLWGQYLKLWRKWKAGADYFVTMPGLDVRKFHELKLYMERAGMSGVPVLGTVPYMAATDLAAVSRVHPAGVVLTDDVRQKSSGKLLPKAEKARVRDLAFAELAEYQRHFAARQAGLLIDVLTRGLGYRGIYLAGVDDLDTASE
ncbi:MAG: dihydropteroate synthase, partial [Gemmatimonadota bacterium]